MHKFTSLDSLLEAIDEMPDKTWIRWWTFHTEHPEVAAYLLNQARLVLSSGRSEYSIKTLYNVARWHFQFERSPKEAYKLNDLYHSRYSRLLMAENDDMAGFFRLRELRG